MHDEKISSVWKQKGSKKLRSENSQGVDSVLNPRPDRRYYDAGQVVDINVPANAAALLADLGFLTLQSDSFFLSSCFD